MKQPQLYDVTLRDGNHAVRHQLTLEFAHGYALLADQSQVDVVEAGHGMGLGASSELVGLSLEMEQNYLMSVRSALKGTRLGVHVIPGFATIDRNLRPAVEIGVDCFRIGTHVTEADTAAPHIAFLRECNREVVGVLMMSHMVDVPHLVHQAVKLATYGCQSITIMDSSGHYSMEEVKTRIDALVNGVECPVGFHAHNNFGLSVANSLAALDAGATSVDASSMGLGAGAGNAQMECLVACLIKASIAIELRPFLDMSDYVRENLPESLPVITSAGVVSGIHGVVSAFAPYVTVVARELGISQERLWAELGNRKVVAGQESMIREVAIDLLGMTNEDTS